MELLPQGQKNTATEVSWEDQQRINKFSSLINKKDDLQDTLKNYTVEKEYLDDLGLEIEMLDEEEKIQYKIGEAFFFLSVEQATRKIEKADEELASKISKTEETIDEIDEQLSSLKKQLYAKFGSNINLER
ncbi:Prefoldin subunit 4 [Meyerozyma sp. JA9]|nr:Prefoldin subunit 4 [Meyerozyma sp. JA9]